MWYFILLLICTPITTTLVQDSGQSTDIDVENRGLIFLRSGKFLLSGDKWTLTFDINLDDYRQSIAKMAPSMANLKILTRQANSTVEKQIPNSIQSIVSRETNYLEKQSTVILKRLDDLGRTIDRQASSRRIYDAPQAGYKGRKALGSLQSINKDIRTEQIRQSFKSLREDGIVQVDEEHEEETANRQKRGLMNLGGSFAKYLFGTLDQRDLHKINEKLLNHATTIETMKHFMDAQFTYLNTTAEILERQNKSLTVVAGAMTNIAADITLLGQNISSEISRLETQLSVTVRLDSAMRGFQSGLGQVRNELTRLEEAIEEAAHGKLSYYFISPTKLYTILSEVNNHLPTDRSLLTPLSVDEMYEYYSIAKVHAAIVEDRKIIRLFVDIPLKGPNLFFTLYEAKSLPVFHPETNTSFMYRPTHPYLAISENKMNFMELDMTQLQHCENGRIAICPPYWPVRSEAGTSCLFSLFKREMEDIKRNCHPEFLVGPYEVFLRPADSSTWIYSVSNPVTVTVQCPAVNSSIPARAEAVLLDRTGSINVDPICSVNHRNFQLLSHSHTILEVEKFDPEYVLPPSHEILKIPIKVTDGNIDVSLFSRISRDLNRGATAGSLPSIPIARYNEEWENLKAIKTKLDGQKVMFNSLLESPEEIAGVVGGGFASLILFCCGCCCCMWLARKLGCQCCRSMCDWIMGKGAQYEACPTAGRRRRRASSESSDAETRHARDSPAGQSTHRADFVRSQTLPQIQQRHMYVIRNPELDAVELGEITRPLGEPQLVHYAVPRSSVEPGTSLEDEMKDIQQVLEVTNPPKVFRATTAPQKPKRQTPLSPPIGNFPDEAPTPSDPLLTPVQSKKTTVKTLKIHVSD